MCILRLYCIHLSALLAVVTGSRKDDWNTHPEQPLQHAAFGQNQPLRELDRRWHQCTSLCKTNSGGQRYDTVGGAAGRIIAPYHKTLPAKGQGHLARMLGGKTVYQNQ